MLYQINDCYRFYTYLSRIKHLVMNEHKILKHPVTTVTMFRTMLINELFLRFWNQIHGFIYAALCHERHYVLNIIQVDLIGILFCHLSCSHIFISLANIQTIMKNFWISIDVNVTSVVVYLTILYFFILFNLK